MGTIFYTRSKELERNNLRNAFFNSNEIRGQSMESFKYSVKIESSYFAAGTKTAFIHPRVIYIVS